MTAAVYEGSTQADFDSAVAYYSELGYVIGQTERDGDCVRMHSEGDSSLAAWVAIWKKPLTSGSGFKVLSEEY